MLQAPGGCELERHLVVNRQIANKFTTNCSQVSKQVSQKSVYNPTTAPLDKRKKWRASSASRAERGGCGGSHTSSLDEELSSRYVFLIGGKEHGQLTVFQRPISVWKLQLASSVY